MHPFEKAGLGKAPFRCVGVSKRTYQACPGAPVQPGGSCNFCGTGIVYFYHIVGSDGSKFDVGSDCVMKTGGEAEVAGMRETRLKLQREMRAESTRARREAQAKIRNERYATERAERLAAFVAAEPELCKTLEAIPDGSGFMVEMRDAVRRWGSLTEGQLRAVKASLAREAAKAAERENSQHVGTVGKRYKGSFTIAHATQRTDKRFWPPKPSYWFLLKSGDNVFTYRGSSRLGEIGETFEATFTVKDHTEYQGTRQTVLARPHFAAEPAPKPAEAAA